LITEMSGPQSWSGSSASATFTQPGLYAITVDQFDIGGYDGVTLLENWSAIPTASLYTIDTSRATSTQAGVVSEPASLLVLAGGIVGCAVARWSRGRNT
jgi:hypothetical protein